MAVPARLPSRSQETRDRLIEAAGAVFAARGYRGGTMREIAERAGTNLAAAHYHFGSKLDLYREVVREHFERLEARLRQQGGAFPADLEARSTTRSVGARFPRSEPQASGESTRPARSEPPAGGEPARLGRDELVALLRARIRTLLDTLLGTDEVHAALVLRELGDPSEVLPFMVRRWIDPLRRDTERILAALAPDLDAESVVRATRSVVGQVFFYRTHRAALLLMMGRRAYPRDFADEVADHVVAFTLAGLAGLAQRRPARARRPRRPR